MTCENCDAADCTDMITHLEGELEKARKAALDTKWPQIAAWTYTVLVHRVRNDDEPGQMALAALRQAGEDVGLVDEAYSERTKLMNDAGFMSMDLAFYKKRVEELTREIAHHTCS